MFCYIFTQFLSAEISLIQILHLYQNTKSWSISSCWNVHSWQSEEQIWISERYLQASLRYGKLEYKLLSTLKAWTYSCTQWDQQWDETYIMKEEIGPQCNHKRQIKRSRRGTEIAWCSQISVFSWLYIAATDSCGCFSQSKRSHKTRILWECWLPHFPGHGA